jgi:hypothetical protein
MKATVNDVMTSNMVAVKKDTSSKDMAAMLPD